MSGRSRWIRQERLVALALGGTRVPNSGFGQVDVEHAYFGVQVKTFKQMPVWLATYWAQTERDAKLLRKVPLLALCHAPGQGLKVERYAVLRMDDLARLLERAGINAGDTA
jgi:hypothetical protein